MIRPFLTSVSHWAESSCVNCLTIKKEERLCTMWMGTTNKRRGKGKGVGVIQFLGSPFFVSAELGGA